MIIASMTDIRRGAGSALLLVALLTGCGAELAVQPADAPTPTAAPTRPPYNPDDLRTVERRDLLDTVTGRASIVPKVTDELFFRRDGRIDTVDVASGDEVKQGQVLARLEQTDLVYQIGLARIDLDLAQLRDRQARANDASELDLAVVAKEVERARLALERLETEQKSLLITAPYNGRISDITAKPGSEITAFQPVVTIVGTDELVIHAEFSGPKGGRIAVGQEVTLQDFFDDTISFGGIIAGNVVNEPEMRIIEPADDAPKLKLGDSFKVTAVLGGAEQALVIPSEAVKTLGERRYVLLVEKGELRRVFVETGIESDGLVQITAGLDEGQQISER
jgi:RND family efflux transporter MFP subunit